MKTHIFVLACTAVTMAACGGSQSSSTTSSSCSHEHGEVKKIITAQAFIKPDKIDAFLAAANEAIEKSRAEAGNTSYSLFQDPEDPTKFLFFEEWKNQDAVDTHFATDHFQNFGGVLGDCSSSAAIITIYDCIDHDHGDLKKLISAQIFVKPEKVDAFLDFSKELIEKSRAEAGCISYRDRKSTRLNSSH